MSERVAICERVILDLTGAGLIDLYRDGERPSGEAASMNAAEIDAALREWVHLDTEGRSPLLASQHRTRSKPLQGPPATDWSPAEGPASSVRAHGRLCR